MQTGANFLQVRNEIVHGIAVLARIYMTLYTQVYLERFQVVVYTDSMYI
jgi:hypothetical protein